jgi:hypothetical protein
MVGAVIFTISHTRVSWTEQGQSTEDSHDWRGMGRHVEDGTLSTCPRGGSAATSSADFLCVQVYSG